MAITKYTYLDDAGLQTLAEELLRGANTRIKERIITGINDASYTDNQRVLAASVVLALIGKEGNTTANDGTIRGLIQALQAEVGTSEDDSSDETVYGAIAKTKEDIMSEIGTADDDSDEETVYGTIAKTKEELIAQITALTHLTYETVTGDITEIVTSPKSDVIYLQQDTEDDDTWNLFIYNESKSEWICVGETKITLQNYWDKSDESVSELQNKIVGLIPTETIESKVAAAFAATDPFGSSASDAYME